MFWTTLKSAEQRQCRGIARKAHLVHPTQIVGGMPVIWSSSQPARKLRLVVANLFNWELFSGHLSKAVESFLRWLQHLQKVTPPRVWVEIVCSCWWTALKLQKSYNSSQVFPRNDKWQSANSINACLSSYPRFLGAHVRTVDWLQSVEFEFNAPEIVLRSNSRANQSENMKTGYCRDSGPE